MRLVERNALRRPIVELFTALAAEATSPDHPAHAYFVERYESTVARIGEQLSRRAREGGLRDGVEPDVAARQLVALMDGLQVQWLLSSTVRGPSASTWPPTCARTCASCCPTPRADAAR